MAPLRNSDRAILEIRKIEDYCLNPNHPRGRHKARVFRNALGIDQTDAEWLRRALLAALPGGEATELATDAFGTRWLVDVPVARHGSSVVVRTVWIICADEQTPRFVTCWVL